MLLSLSAKFHYKNPLIPWVERIPPFAGRQGGINIVPIIHHSTFFSIVFLKSFVKYFRIKYLFISAHSANV